MMKKIKKFLKADFYEKLNLIGLFYYLIKTQFFTKYFYKHLGQRTIIFKPLKITPKWISIGKSSVIYKNCRIEGVANYAGKDYYPSIIIGDKVTIQQNLHLTCANKVMIAENVAIAANVTITDIDHNYHDINLPIEEQNLNVSSVSIGKDSKIYNNVVILPGVNIGVHCVIGANSVVNKDIPDYSIVVGAPAKIVKRYNFVSNRWEQTNEKGEFLSEI